MPCSKISLRLGKIRFTTIEELNSLEGKPSTLIRMKLSEMSILISRWHLSNQAHRPQLRPFNLSCTRLHQWYCNILAKKAHWVTDLKWSMRLVDTFSAWNLFKESSFKAMLWRYEVYLFSSHCMIEGRQIGSWDKLKSRRRNQEGYQSSKRLDTHTGVLYTMKFHRI